MIHDLLSVQNHDGILLHCGYLVTCDRIFCFGFVLNFRIVFAFGPEEVKSFSNELLTDKGSGGRQQRPMSSTDLLLNRGLAGKDWRYSAPSGADRKRNRDSMGSIDYLSDAGSKFPCNKYIFSYFSRRNHILSRKNNNNIRVLARKKLNGVAGFEIKA